MKIRRNSRSGGLKGGGQASCPPPKEQLTAPCEYAYPTPERTAKHGSDYVNDAPLGASRENNRKDGVKTPYWTLLRANTVPPLSLRSAPQQQFEIGRNGGG